MRESYGLVFWVIAVLTDTLHAYWRTLGQFAIGHVLCQR